MTATTTYLVNRDCKEVQAVIDECASKRFGNGFIDVSTVEQAQQLTGVGAIAACVPSTPVRTPKEVDVRQVLKNFPE